MMAEISIAGDFVIRVNQKADKIHFVQNGSLEVLASDNLTTIALIGLGSYFGEIGILITGKRTASVRAISNCMTYSIKGQDFLQILQDHPIQEKFLRAVGYQRLQTTGPEDIIKPRSDHFPNQSVVSGLFDDTLVNPAASHTRALQKSNTFSFLKKDTVPVEK